MQYMLTRMDFSKSTRLRVLGSWLMLSVDVIEFTIYHVLFVTYSFHSYHTHWNSKFPTGSMEHGMEPTTSRTSHNSTVTYYTRLSSKDTEPPLTEVRPRQTALLQHDAELFRQDVQCHARYLVLLILRLRRDLDELVEDLVVSLKLEILYVLEQVQQLASYDVIRSLYQHLQCSVDIVIAPIKW